jgi:hypothetical protein
MLRILTLIAHVLMLSWVVGGMADTVPYGYTLVVVLLTITGTGLTNNLIDELRESRSSII